MVAIMLIVPYTALGFNMIKHDCRRFVTAGLFDPGFLRLLTTRFARDNPLLDWKLWPE